MSGRATEAKRVAVPPKVKRRIIIRSSNSPSGRYTKESKAETQADICMYTHVHSSMIHGSPKREATQVSIEG